MMNNRSYAVVIVVVVKFQATIPEQRLDRVKRVCNINLIVLVKSDF